MDNREPYASSDEPTGGTARGGYGNTEYGSTAGVRSGGTSGRGRARKRDSGSTGDQLTRTAGQVTDQVQQQAGQVADRVQAMATGQAESRLDRAADTVKDVAQAMEQVGRQLRTNDQPQIAGYADMAADRLNGVAQYLRQQDVGQLAGDVQDFARRQPTLFLGGAFLLGFLGARFLKSSSPSSDSTGDNFGGGRWSYQPPAYYGRRGYTGAGYAPRGYGQPPIYGTGTTGTRDYDTGQTPDTAGYGAAHTPGTQTTEDYGTTGTRYGGRGNGTGGTRGTEDFGADTGEAPRTGVE